MERIMLQRFRHLRDDERGMSVIFVGLSFMAVRTATMLAIDGGMLMTARSQAQNSADAGALAGATAMVFNDFNDRTATGPIVTSALNAAKANQVIGQAPSVLPADVTFPIDPLTGQSDLVEVTVYRTTDRSNPVATLIAQLFGVPTANIRARARAGAFPAGAEQCVLPFTIPDKWIENQCGTPPCTWQP